jgi:hypothetical protein
MDKFKPPTEELKVFESDKLWQNVSNAIKQDDQQKATDEKAILEQAQRTAAKERENNEVKHQCKLFEEVTTYHHQGEARHQGTWCTHGCGLC